MRTLILLLIAAAILAGGWWLWSSHATHTTPAAAAASPQILSIDFPKQINGDGNDVKGTIQFRAPTGTITQADFAVVTGDFFSPFSFDPQVQGKQQGSFDFFISSIVPQQVTLRVTITDDQGRKSPPQDFSFTVVPAANMPTMPGNPGM
jgi:ABC-type amino acid transport substrate-binding protein